MNAQLGWQFNKYNKMKYCSAGACVAELFALLGTLQHTRLLLTWVQRSDVAHFMYRAKKKSKISNQVACSQGELVSEDLWLGLLNMRSWGRVGQSPAGRSQSCRISPKKRITWIKTSAEVRMSDPDPEKNNILSAQYKLAIVTIIPMLT